MATIAYFHARNLDAGGHSAHRAAPHQYRRAAPHQYRRAASRGLITGEHALGTPYPHRITLPDRITFPDRMQPSDTAKDVPAKSNGSLGIKSRTMIDRWKTPQRQAGNFPYNDFFTMGEERYVVL